VENTTGGRNDVKIVEGQNTRCNTRQPLKKKIKAQVFTSHCLSFAAVILEKHCFCGITQTLQSVAARRVGPAEGAHGSLRRTAVCNAALSLSRHSSFCTATSLPKHDRDSYFTILT